jgi:hypothetical protein
MTKITARLSESTDVHTRLLKCALEVDEARAYWQHVTPGSPPDPKAAFEGYWFGAKSLDRVKVLLANFRHRFDAYPEALQVLHGWRHVDPATRTLVCHWHLQLSDPMYRAFTGEYLVDRRDQRPEITHDLVLAWVTAQDRADRWTTGTRVQFASKLLSASHRAGLVTSTRDPRPLAFPRVDDLALTYAVYLLRGVDFAGTLLDNPYLRSVGLEGATLEERLRKLQALGFQRQGDLLDFGWRYPDLPAWAAVLPGGPS